MANLLISRPLTPFLLKRDVGTSFGLIRGSVGPVGLSVAPSLEMSSVGLKLNVARATRDGGESFDDMVDPALRLRALSIGMHLSASKDWSIKRNKIIIMVKWLSSLSQIPELKGNPEFCNEALESRENKIKEILKREDQMSKSPIDPKTRSNLTLEIDAIYCDIFEVFTKYQYECTAEKIDDMSLSIMLREIINKALYPRMKETGEILSTMALNKTRLLRTDQSCLWEKDLVEGLTFFGGRLMYTAECAITIPIFAEFAVERQKFMDSLNFQCHTQLGAYDLLYTVISTIREFDSLLLQCEDEIDSYLQDGFLKFSQDNGDVIMSDSILELKTSRAFILLTEKEFKELEKDMRSRGHVPDYQKASKYFLDTLVHWIFGCNAAVEGFKRLI